MEGARKFMNQVDVVVYHSPCDDGHAAAALFYFSQKTATLVGIHPKDNLLTDAFLTLVKDKNVVFVDIAFDKLVMTAVAVEANKVLVLDHHVTNQTTLEELVLPNLYTVFKMDVAGVCLAHSYLFGDDMPMPPAFYFIGLKDVWKHEQNLSAVYFTTAFKRPETWEEWRPFFGGEATNRVIDQGRVVYEYQQSVLKTMMEKVQYTTWRGFRIAIVNVPFPWISDIGAKMCETEPEKTIAVVWNKPANGPYSVSLRSNNPHGPNVEQIALELKGGGHVHGAGLRLDRPPYEVFTDTGIFQ